MQLSLDITQFSCSDVGENTVTLFITDQDGNISTCTAIVTIENPVALSCQNHTVSLDENGNATILVTDIDNGSTSPCGTQGLFLDKSSFNCSDLSSTTNEYTLDKTGTFNPIAGEGTNVFLGDDQVSTALPIGFTFNFYETDYTEFYLSSNGFITFSPNQSNGCCSGQTIPSSGNPNNLIAFGWLDLNPQAGGQMDYYTTGVAPNRKLIINITDLPNFGSNTGDLTTQIQLSEGSNLIEIHTTHFRTGFNYFTIGIENQDGTIGVSEFNGQSSSNTIIKTNDYTAFIPGGQQIVNLIHTDNFGNLTTCQSLVKVEDHLAPDCIAKDFVLELDASGQATLCLLYTSPSPRDATLSRMPSSA